MAVMPANLEPPAPVARGTCLGGCGRPRPWPWVTCGRGDCHPPEADAVRRRLEAIRQDAGRPPWRTGPRP